MQVERRKVLFSFPKDPAYHRRWVQNMGLENFVIKDHLRFCEKHFTEEQFQVSPSVIESLGMSGEKRPKLKVTASQLFFFKDGQNPAVK